MADDDSSSDDDEPLIPINKPLIKQNGNNNNSNNSSDSSSSDDDPLIKPTNNNTTNKRNTNNNNNNRSPKHNGRKRNYNKFRDSDDSDDSSNSEESDHEPIITPSITSSPKKRRKISISTSENSPIIKKKRSQSSTTSYKKKRKKRKLDEDEDIDINMDNNNSNSRPGYINRDVFKADTYPVKPEIVPLQPDQNAKKWWELPQKKNKRIKWSTLDHNGIVFAPEYEQHNIKMLYDKKPINLTKDQEEIATMFAVMMDTDYAKKETFQKNFMKDWKKVLRDPKQARRFPEITSFKKCNFKPIYDWYNAKKLKDKELRKSKEWKEEDKKIKDEFDKKYGWALVDGVLEKVGNYKVEPPGLFRGRGTHPKMGLLKKRIMPEDIILNIGKGKAIPKCPIPGHQWGGVIHDFTVTYIAKWIENINEAHKFVYLHASSRFKGEADRDKYEKARKLKKHVNKIRQDYTKKMKSDNLIERQLATAVWMIDHLSIRVGNEKDLDEEADTVGVCSLRVEHCKLLGYNNDKKSYEIRLDFLGKDSMRYLQTVKVPNNIYKNIEKFMTNKGDDHDIFHKIQSDVVNKYLKEHMKGLTAKVFRTHNASVTLQNELNKNIHPKVGQITKDSLLDDKLFYYNYCNKQVAILCNHQRTVSKSHKNQLEKIDEILKKYNNELKLLKIELKIAQGKMSIDKKPDDIKKIRNEIKIKELIQKKKQMIRKKQLSREMKEDNKEVALGTSKINYMDPRITVAWCKRFEVPIEKVFNKSLQDKFPWAMSETMNYEF